MAEAQTIAVQRVRAFLASDIGVEIDRIAVTNVVRSLVPHAPGQIDIGPRYAFEITLGAAGMGYRCRYFEGRVERLS